MPKFRYIAKNTKGETLSATVEAFDRSSLVRNLQRDGLFVIKVEDAITKARTSEKDGVTAGKKFTHKKIKLDDLLSFARQLCTMLEAGVTLLRSLEVITEQMESELLYKLLRQVTKDVQQGSALSEALAKHPRIFNQFWVSLVEVGETSGTMPMVLNKLANYLEQQAAFRSTIVSAMIYPIILFFVCIGAVAFFALFVGPKFESVFKSMNVELPMITKILLATFRFIKEKFLFITGGIGAAVFILRRWIQTRAGRLQAERFYYSMPVFGKVYKLIIVERFTSQMAILVDTGVPILHALDIASRLVNNITCGKIINDIKEAVRQGELLAAPMERSKFFPGLCTQMITVGEETGELSKMFKHVAKFYQDAVETFMKRFGTMVEPFMLVFMGAVIGVIVLAMFLPMFNIASLGGATH